MLEFNERARGPQPRLNLLSGHYFARSLQKHDKNLKRLVLKPDLQPVFAQLSRSAIHFENAEAHNLGSFIDTLHWRLA